MTSKNRRDNHPPSDAELYKSDVDTFIKSERRRDELERLNEVKEQNATWIFTVRVCAIINLIFLILALYGWITYGFI